MTSPTISGDIIIIGAGVAGLATALRLAPRPVTLLTKAPLGIGAASDWAQGGIAAAIGADDAPALHAADTLAAGAGLVDPAIADLVATAGPRQIDYLLSLGVPFDKAPDGSVACGQEAAHSRRRIAHVKGDGTGHAVMEALIRAVQTTPSITVLSGLRATDLIVGTTGQIAGVVAKTETGQDQILSAGAVILATGGTGQLYSRTTNPSGARGQGLVMAARAGAELADLEFVQFHPTALNVAADPLPLLTEALRGEGCPLIDANGQRFMAALHPLAELAPRDVVARGIWGQPAAFLDCRTAIGPAFPDRFPTIFATCQTYGLDPRTTPLPVTPAAHYHMGGVRVDANGQTSILGLYACGEVAATGLHGANRLASNSLLEALVFAERIAGQLQGQSLSAPPLPASIPRHVAAFDAAAEANLRALMYEKVGLMRDATSLTAALDWIVKAGNQAEGSLFTLARLVTFTALARQESRGGHARRDYPDLAPPQHNIVTLAGVDADLFGKPRKMCG
jgi:L-aspartate oxidase